MVQDASAAYAQYIFKDGRFTSSQLVAAYNRMSDKHQLSLDENLDSIKQHIQTIITSHVASTLVLLIGDACNNVIC